MLNFIFFGHRFSFTRPALAGLALLLMMQSTLAENASTSKPEAPVAPIALLLPLNTTAFRSAADAVKQGFLAASKNAADAPDIRVYPTSDDVAAILGSYEQAVKNGARFVVGPLTKNAVTALAESELALVPTLALSVPDNEINRANLYLFGLSLEAEVRQLATYMARAGHHNLLIVSAATALDKRLQTALTSAWTQQGGTVLPSIAFNQGADLNALREQVRAQPADAIFLATNGQEARLLRPYLSASLPTYATSLVFNGEQAAQAVDLAGVRFLDMPWLLQPDHPAVMVYPRGARGDGDLARLYGLGIDAFRLVQLMYRGALPATGEVLDGVTGRISLGAGRQFNRELTAAEFQPNAVVVLDDGQP